MARTRRLLTVAALALAAAALAFTWYRLFLGCDLTDESFSVLVPWRWSLGDRPFVDEMDLAQVAGFLTYPFIKLFALVRGDSTAGIILFARHLYLLFVIGVAGISFLFLRRLLRWQLALAVCMVTVTFVFRATPNLTYNTLAMGLLTVGFILGLWAMERGGWGLAALAGLAHGGAVVAFPTLLFVMPFVAMFFVLAQGRQARALVAGLSWQVADDPLPEGEPTGRAAFRRLAPYVAGALVAPAVVAVIAVLAGPRNVYRCWHFTIQAAKSLDQLAGAAKAVDVTVGIIGFVLSQWPLLLGLAAAYLVFRWRPRLGRALLALLPIGLYAAGRHGEAEAAGLVLAYGLLAPYLYAMLPARRRAQGAAALISVWPSAAILAAMTAYTSTDGYAHGAVGLYPAVILSGLFLAWDLEAAFLPGEGEGEAPTEEALPSVVPSAHAGAGAWLAFAALAAAVAVTVVFQFHYQVGGARYEELTARLDSGPWAAISVTQEQRVLLQRYAADLAARTRPDEALLVYFRNPGLYLYWPYRLGTNSVSLQSRPSDDPFAMLPESTIAWYRRTRRLPDVVIHVCPTALATDARLEQCGGLWYPVALVRQDYAVNRRPVGKSTREILDSLPRQH